ncbi:MAG: hypothetical protein KDA61_07855 [Planctomycetales bacterium]|nr:hypothetical protein [Planctomycetales bacterium]
MKSPRIACLGANRESEVVLQALVAGGANVAAVVTLPPGAAAGVCDYVDLHPFCATHNIPTVDCRHINSSPVRERLAAFKPDYLYVLGWSEMLADDALSLPAQYVVGSHPSDLPEGRGRAPVPWAILEDRDELVVSLFRMVRGADAGPLLLQRRFRLPARPYASEVYELVAENLGAAFCDLHAMHVAGSGAAATPQDERRASYRARRGPADGRLAFQRSAEEIERLVRAVSEPYPGAYAYYGERRISVWRARVETSLRMRGAEGQILRRDGERLLVQTAAGLVWLWEFSEAGHRIDACEFRTGERFGYAVEDEIFALRRQIADLQAAVAGRREAA